MRKKITFALLSLLLVPLGMMAQDVTISAAKGDLIAGAGGANTSDSGKSAGFFSTWKHKQLALTVNGSDMGFLTQAGDLFDPSCVITSLDGDNLVVANGQTQTFLVVSLPKGYRITGYEAVLQPINGSPFAQVASSWNGKSNAMWFYETEAWNSESPFTEDTKDTYDSGATPLSDTQYLAVAKTSTGEIEMNQNATDAAKEFKISRTAIKGSDGSYNMGNRLYFWVAMSGNYYSFTIKKFVLYFTAEGMFEAEVEPKTVGSATNYVTSPFTTSKTDFGEVSDTLGRMYYRFWQVKDIVAYTHLYQEDAAASGIPAAGSGDIHPVDIDGEGHYAFGNNTYFVEPPTTYKTTSGQEAPIGFRVVGATFKWLAGKQTTGGTQTISNACYVYYGTMGSSYGGYAAYYLTNNLFFGTRNNQSQATITRANATAWHYDEFGNMYIGSGDYKQYLACYGEGNTRVLSLSSSASGASARFNLRPDSDGHLYYLSDGGNYYYLYTKPVTEGGATHYRGYLVKSPSTGTYANRYGYVVAEDGTTVYTATSNAGGGYTAVTSVNSGTQTVTLPSFNPGGYTFKIYQKDDKTGAKTPLFEKTVSADEATIAATATNSTEVLGEYDFEGFNNDAVRFSVEGLGENQQALIDVTLKLEALNPYIDQMTVNCTDPVVNVGTEENPQPLRISQTFKASDFGVNGGAFHFVLPDRCKDHDVNITFEDLYSHYGDDTYKDGEGNARYSFVTSPYFLAFDDVTKDESVKSTDSDWEDWMDDSSSDLGLYDDRYDPDIASTKKIYTGVAGTEEFTFNNAGVLTSGGSFTEYPFSVAKYLATTAEGGTGGKFKQIELNPETDPEGTYYLFTADETRYNIAPTKAWEHRSYAFYKMDVSVESTTYTPNVEFVPVYEHTCYAKEILDEDGNVTGMKDTDEPFYGAVITADAEGQPGYASTADVFKIIASSVKGSDETGTIYDEDGTTPIGSYSGKAEGLTNAKQLLYLDFSNLAGTYQITTEDHTSMDDYSKTNAENVLIFLPVGASAPNNNVAAKTQAGNFRAAHDIVLTDKQPFFSPYDIMMGDNKATYAREITVDKYGNPNKQSLILPFDLTLSGDTYIGSKSSFKVTQLTSAAMTDNAEKECVQATFAAVSGNAAANTPYMVDIQSTDKPGTFTVEQQGAVIKATTAAKTSKDHMFYDTEVKATYTGDGTQHTFYPRGSFSGKIYDATEDDFRGSNVFFYYGSNNMFRSSAALNTNYQTLKAYPFRSFYGYSGPDAAGAKQLTSFLFSYGSEETNGISELTKRIDFAVQSGKGYLRVTTGKDANVCIYTLNGMKVAAEQMLAGETHTVNLPAGVYIVNGVKIIVK